jgi:putative transposase
MNRTYVNACPLVSSIAAVREKPNFFGQKKTLTVIKKDLVRVVHSGELLDFRRVDSTVLQDVSKRVELAFSRFIKGDSNGNRSGRPRFKTEADYKTMVFATAKDEWVHLVRKRWMYVRLPKVGMIKVRMHRALPFGASVKRLSLCRKADGWYINLLMEDKSVPTFEPETVEATWDNSMGIDAVLKGDDYIATSEGTKYPSVKLFRSAQAELDEISKAKASKPRGSRVRRKLAKKEARFHQRIARQRQAHRYKLAHALVRTGKKVFFPEDLNLKGLTRRNKAKQAEDGTFLPNGQAAKSGLNKSWNDAAFGLFLTTLDYIAEKAGAVVRKQKPAYTSMLLSYRNEIAFPNLNVREYSDGIERIMVDRDINAAINLKKRGLGIFPTIKRSRGNLSISGDIDNSTVKSILDILRDSGSPLYSPRA